MKHTFKQRFAEDLFEIGAIKFGAFRLKLHEKNPDAPLSPIYLDLRLLQSYPKILKGAAIILMNIADSEGIEFDLFAGVPTAAIPLVTTLSQETSIPMITPREAKTHGSGATIDGAYKPGQRVLLVDGLITKADSKIAAIKTLEANDLIVHDVIVLVDREQGGAKQLQESGYRLWAALTLSELLNFYLATKRINQTKHEEVKDYLVTNS
jgi:uridine monophosphate synthetase